ncbi:MAG: NAD-dependent epimerase/dehydratase family protein [Peptostreptococcus sp.]|uniref:NAD-dependent epimerase/dehydratase family protein n=1 Tax=Peptostreptococcus TaxID=1257 RepID=UPI00290D7560|nr:MULTISPECIES: NAD-dependent epimerase/dehydratase family protein [Peptostreptococcus]MDU5349574.1 NAD-dependent epimerase/dehydratase family protein [Peptostreptococcus sp.]MDU5566612.1 NAD-dependent epimerase/dehydratase family protein [Peptostreptococcus anaerobius]MDU5890421.1 NAD-dependent epimerase/dehydratase family protein [Peptostreptococcus sp.]
MKKILVTGATGQIGGDLISELSRIYGKDKVIGSARRKDPLDLDCNRYYSMDCRNLDDFYRIVKEEKVDTILHLAAILSAKGEEDPNLLWDINVNGLYNALEVSKEIGASLFVPSSIGAFGPSTPKDKTPQNTIQRPTTAYGVSKVTGELLCDYYHQKYGLDTRGVRFPGLISHKTLPGGGTTDYAVHIYYEAIKNKHYTSFIDKGTYMDMMYMPDAIDSIIKLMEADPDKLIDRNAFNVSSMSFEPEDIKRSIQKYIPEFTMDYDVDPVRQSIADSWPNSLDTSQAKLQWGFKPRYDLDAMTKDMLDNLKNKI